MFSTLGGGLTAIDPLTSEIRWTIDDGECNCHALPYGADSPLNLLSDLDWKPELLPPNCPHRPNFFESYQ